MTANLIAQRYAKALFEYSIAERKTSAVHKDFLVILSILSKSVEFRRFINNPVISQSNQYKIFQSIFKKTLSPQTYTCLKFLIYKRRLNLLSEICQNFDVLYSDDKNITKAQLVSHVPLSNQQINDIALKLKKKLNSDIDTESIVDAHMVGGIKVKIKDKIYDYSIRSQLQRFKNRVIHA